MDAERLFERLDPKTLRLNCPVCSSALTHVERVYALEAEKDWKADAEGQSAGGELYGIPVGGEAKGWRRGTVVVEVLCESDHLFQIHFQQHKGNTLVFVQQEAL